MLWIVGIVLIFLGLYFLLSGLVEKTPIAEVEKLYEAEEVLKEDVKEFKKPKKEVKGAGVILIGPIPIVFGESKFAVYALILTIVLMIISFLVMFSL